MQRSKRLGLAFGSTIKNQKLIQDDLGQHNLIIQKSLSLASSITSWKHKNQLAYDNKKTSYSLNPNEKNLLFRCNQEKSNQFKQPRVHFRDQKKSIRQHNPQVRNSKFAQQNNRKLILKRREPQQNIDKKYNMANIIIKLRQMIDKFDQILKTKLDNAFQIQLGKLLKKLATQSSSVMILEQYALQFFYNALTIFSKCMERRQIIKVKNSKQQFKAFIEEFNSMQIKNKKLSLDLQLLRSKYNSLYQKRNQHFQPQISKIDVKNHVLFNQKPQKSLINMKNLNKQAEANAKYSSSQKSFEQSQITFKLNAKTIKNLDDSFNPNLQIAKLQNNCELIFKKYQKMKLILTFLDDIKGINVLKLLNQHERTRHRTSLRTQNALNNNLCDFYKEQMITQAQTKMVYFDRDDLDQNKQNFDEKVSKKMTMLTTGRQQEPYTSNSKCDRLNINDSTLGQLGSVNRQEKHEYTNFLFQHQHIQVGKQKDNHQKMFYQ